MITLQDVSKTYAPSGQPPISAVRRISLEIASGEFVVITGRSGCGKTTLLSLIAGLTQPTSGRVLLDGQEVWRLPDQEQSLRRNTDIGFVFQFPRLLPTLNALENVMTPTLFGPRQAAETVRTRAYELLAQVGLADKPQAFPRELSGGQQQRVVIARALMNRPKLLLADEPTSDLDEHTEQDILSLFREIHARTGVTVLLVTHSSELAHFGSRSIQMADGEIVA